MEQVQITKFIFYVTSGISLTVLALLIGYFNYKRRYPEKFEKKDKNPVSKNKKKAQKRKKQS